MNRAFLYWQINDLIRQLAWKALFSAVVYDYEGWKLPWIAENSAGLRGTP